MKKYSLTEEQRDVLVIAAHDIGLILNDDNCPRGIRQILTATYLKLCDGVLNPAGITRTINKKGKIKLNGVTEEWPTDKQEQWKALK